MSLEAAKAHWKAGRTREALAEAWKAYDAAPAGFAERRLLSRILDEDSMHDLAGRGESLRTLLTDPDLDPGQFSAAGWHYLRSETELFAGPDDAGALAARLEQNALALTLLREDPVLNAATERALTQVRRRLLVDGRRNDFPRLCAALVAQAALNGGAWSFDEDERALVSANPDFAPAYLPPRETPAPAAGFADPVTRKVAEQYEGWPYPPWRRVPKAEPTTLCDHLRELDPGGAGIAEPAEILIAGCGTGRQVALLARRFPTARLVAIDVSAASLAYARARCGELANVEFRLLDLHDVASLGRKFDAVMCTGVLHHLPDPEAGWATLHDALKSGGLMHVMVYSKLARMRIAATRRHLKAFQDRAMSDDLLREVRQTILSRPDIPEFRSRDFFTLAGVHDLLMHRHEDPFDIARIRRAIEALGLKLLRFDIPDPAAKAAYRAERSDDPLQRDFAGWQSIERANPTLYSRMYDFWCRRP